MSSGAILAAALLLDAALGEPRWLWNRVPHPAVLMGRVISYGDELFNRGPSKRLNGIALMVGLCIGAIIIGTVLEAFGSVVEVIVLAILLAHRSLVDHVAYVAQSLRLSVGDGRHAVAMIVGRDTTDMDETAVSRAAIESGAENFSDGVIAPAFWFLIAGLPGLLIYKITNTADSMIGYRTPRHQAFGWAAARFDDLLNLIPARLTAALIAVSFGIRGQWRAIRADARLHRSPNAGWPEAAFSRALGIALSGPRSYDGHMRDYPFVNPAGHRQLTATHIETACSGLWRSWALALTLVVLIALIG